MTDQSLLVNYQRLLDISRDLASTLDLSELLYRIVHAAADLCGTEEASILLYDQNRQDLRFEAATNLDDPFMRGVSVPVDSSLAGWMVTNRQPVLIDNVENDARHFGQVGVAVNMQIKSLLGVPLIRKEKVIGALEAVNKRSGSFSIQDQELLSALGAQAAIAIENSRLFQQTDLISDLVHELRTPLASLNTAAHLIPRPDITEEQRSRFISIIQQEISRLSDLTTSFLDLARLESGRTQFHSETFALKPLLEDCLEIMHSRAEEKSLSLSGTIPADLPDLKGDKDKIQQVMLNLLSNAIKYNYPQGQVVLTVHENDHEIIVSVSDTGPGISAENLTHLFEKFYRVPGTEKLALGTGLGLSICKRIVEAHGGKIDVQSQVERGTTFSVHLPLIPPAHQAA
jgi:signal transduction histidine kinase